MSIWENKGGGWYALAAMAQDEIAVLRGGHVWVHPATMRTKVIPWSDDSGDVICMTPEITGPLSAPAPTEYGWTAIDMATGTKWEVVSLQETKWRPYLDGFDAPGWKMLRWVNVADIVYQGDQWRPKSLIIDATPGLMPYVQPVDGADTPAMAGSVAWYHDSKANNFPGIGKNYCTGKIYHMPAPLTTAWGSGGEYLGNAKGAWEYSGGMLHKVFDKWDIEALEALGATQLCTDATLGYETTPSFGTITAHATLLQNIGTMPNNGEVQSLHHRRNSTALLAPVFLGIYTNKAGPLPDTVVANSGIETGNLTTNAWHTITYTGTKPTLLTGLAYWLCYTAASTNRTCSYDLVTGGGWRASKTTVQIATTATNFQSPLTETLTNNDDFRTGFYITYTAVVASGGGGVSINPLVLSRYLRQ